MKIYSIKEDIMLIKRNRFVYFRLVIIMIILGLTSRHFSSLLPNWINLYLGDILWACMVFFMFGFIFRTKKTIHIAVIALVFSFSIEFSQLYHSGWIDALRGTIIGKLVLGYGFMWSDLVSYSIGIIIGITSEIRINL